MTYASRILPATRLVIRGYDVGRVAWCDICETRHHHGIACDGGGAYASQCLGSAGAPIASYEIETRGTVDDTATFAPIAVSRSPFWRRMRDRSHALQASVAAAILDERRPSGFLIKAIAGEEVHLQRHRWQAGRREGADLLTLGRHVQRMADPFASVDGMRAGVVAARVLESATGAVFDAHAFLGLVDVVEDFYARGAPYGEGRRT